MPEQEYELAETELEERDGDVWVSGLCPGCWERYAFHAPRPGTTTKVRCPNGHLLLIREQTSAGSHAHAHP